MTATAPGSTDQLRAAGLDAGSADGVAVADEPWRRHFMVTAVLLAFGMFLSILNTAIVGIDYSPIAKELSASQVDIQWVTTAYRAGQAAVIPAIAWVCARLGHRLVFLVTMLAFAVSSALCGVAGSLDQLIAFRVLQAVPGAVPPVVCLLMFNRLIPRSKLPGALAVYIMIVVAAAGFAPLLGGWLGQYWDWRGVFLAEIPCALLGVVVAAWLLPGAPGDPTLRFDWAGFVTGGLAFSALVVAANKGQDWGWTDHRFLTLCALGVDALLLFGWIELRVRRPLLDLRVLLDRNFVVSLGIISVMFTGMFVVLADVPAFLLIAQQLTLTNAGLVMVPQALAWVLSIPLAGMLYRKFDGRVQTTAGLLLLGGGTIALARINVDMPRSTLALLLCVRAVGLGLVLVPLLGAGVATITPHLMAQALTVSMIAQRIISGVGVGVLTAVVAARRAQDFSDRASLLSAEAVTTNPGLAAQSGGRSRGLAQLWQAWQVRGVTQAYSDVFLISGVATLLCLGMLLLIRRTTPVVAAESATTR